MSTLNELDIQTSTQEQRKETLEQRLERYRRFSEARSIEIVLEMHGLPPRNPALSSANNPPVDKPRPTSENAKHIMEIAERESARRDFEIIREMHGLPPKDPTLSTIPSKPSTPERES